MCSVPLDVDIASMRRVARKLVATSVLSPSALVCVGGVTALLGGVLFVAWGYIDRNLMLIELVLQYSVPLLF